MASERNGVRDRLKYARQIAVQLLGGVTTEQGLRVRAELDDNVYDAGVKVIDDQLATIAIERDAFHGEWNGRIRPRGRRTA